jgi:hypothetical protein
MIFFELIVMHSFTAKLSGIMRANEQRAASSIGRPDVPAFLGHFILAMATRHFSALYALLLMFPSWVGLNGSPNNHFRFVQYLHLNCPACAPVLQPNLKITF